MELLIIIGVVSLAGIYVIRNFYQKFQAAKTSPCCCGCTTCQADGCSGDNCAEKI